MLERKSMESPDFDCQWEAYSETFGTYAPSKEDPAQMLCERTSFTKKGAIDADMYVPVKGFLVRASQDKKSAFVSLQDKKD
jgi:hypothetical protein